MTAQLLVASALGKRYGAARGWLPSRRPVIAVDDLSLSVERGQTLGLVGESGCGKSTTGRLLLGIEAPDTGSVAFDGEVLPRGDSPAWRRLRRRLQLVHQDPLGALDRRLPIAEQVAEPLHIHQIGAAGERQERALALLGLVGLGVDYGTRYPHELSGGQRQRVVLARALATQPELLVCDEPISALDVSIQAQVINLFADIQQQLGLAMVFISHDLRAIRQVSARVAVMYLGRIVEEGETDAVLREPLHPYTRALVSAIPSARNTSRRRIVLAGDPPDPAQRPPGCEFHPRCPLAVALCRQERPALKAVAGGTRRMACHLAHGDAAPTSPVGMH